MPLLSSIAAPMHGAVVPIGYATASGSSNQFSFTNIPQTYQDLLVVVYARSTGAVTTTTTNMVINGDSSSSNYSRTILKGDGSSATSSRDTNFSQAYGLDGLPGASSTSGIFSSAEIHILNYANTSTYKTMLSRQAADLNGSGLTELYVTLWRSTSSVQYFYINTNSGNYASGSTIALYGIRTVGQ